MKNQELRSSLMKSGIIMILCVFFIYSFAASDSGGVTGTISSVFSAILFLVGLSLALAASVIVIFGIYFGVLYIYNKDTCKKTYGELKDKVIESTKSLNISCGSACSSSKTVETPITDEALTPLRSAQDKLGSQLLSLQSSVTSLEKTLNTVSSSVIGTAGEIAKLDERAKIVEEELTNKATTDSVDSEITALQGSVTPLSNKVSELEATLSTFNTDEDDSGNELQEKVNSAIAEIKEELATMKEAIEGLSKLPSEKTAAPEGTSNHRILSYFSKKDDEKQFIALVSQAVEKEMTYAEVGEFLNDSLSTEASEVIADHPSLTKDYIRICRQKNKV